MSKAPDELSPKNGSLPTLWESIPSKQLIEEKMIRALKKQWEYHKACKEVYDMFHLPLPELEEILKIGKVGCRERERLYREK